MVKSIDLALASYVRFEKHFKLTMTLFGLVGNLLMFKVYSQKSLSKLSFSTYMRAIAIANLLINIYAIILYVSQKFEFNIHLSSPVMCKSLIFIASLLSPMSSWFEVAAGLDRFLSIVYRNRYKFVQKPRFRILAVIVISVVIMAINSHILFNFYLKKFYIPSKKMVMSVCYTYDGNPIGYIDFANSTVIPFAFMLFTSILTFGSVIASRKKMRKSISRINRLRRIRVRDMKFGITIICLNLAFLVLNAPYRLSHFVDFNPFSSEWNPFENFVFRSVLHLMNESLYSVSFYVQLAINNIVRKELVRLLRRQKRRVQWSSDHTNSN